MKKKLVLVPNKMGSKSAKALAETLTEKLGYKVWRVRPAKVGRRIPFVLSSGTDKLKQFNLFKEANVSTPDFTTDPAVAAGWLAESAVVCRTLLRGSEGRGIVVATRAEEIVGAPLYTRYFKKKKEFRVHVFNGRVIDVAEKKKRKEHSGERDSRIRNVANGYVFCREGLVEPDGLRELAVSATNALGYRLGAVDIAWNEHHNKLVVFEVNATPGMQGSTLENYSNVIINWYKEQL